MLKIALVDDEVNDLLKVIENLVSYDPQARQIIVLPVLLSSEPESSVEKQSVWWQKNNIGPALAARGVSSFMFPSIKYFGPLDVMIEEKRTLILDYFSSEEVDVIISDSWMKEEFAGIKLLDMAVSDPRWADRKWQCWLMTKWDRVAKTIRDFRLAEHFDPYARYLDKNEICRSADGQCDPELERIVKLCLDLNEASTLVRGKSRFGGLVGQSPLMNGKRGVYELIEASTRSPTTTVLVVGDSGTGKELVAEEIHRRSGKPGQFIDANCANFAKELIESELFGHKKGAFTGAISDKQGLFQLAANGTLFLDEIGELPPELQSKLLRVLEERHFSRVGDPKRVNVDNVRVIAATNQRLSEMVKAGSFREDLYYRLNVFPIKLPTLAERREDISLLAQHFTTRFNLDLDRHLSVSDEAIRLLETLDWAGNVRELANCIERAFLLTQSDKINVEDIVACMQLDGFSPVTSVTPMQTGGADPNEIYVKDWTDKTAKEIWQIILSGGLRKTIPQIAKKAGEVKAIQIADLADSWALEKFGLVHPPDKECRRLFGMTNNAYKGRVREYRERFRRPQS